jgi:ADP-ribose pyrophosphatase
MRPRKLTARIKSVTPLANGFLKVNRYELEIDKHEGGTQIGTWELMERGHSVGVLGYDPVRDAVVLVNEFRPGAFISGDYPYTDNLVAGGVATGESPLEAAVREMKEEAGLELRDPQLIHAGAYVSSGGTSEKLALVSGTVDSSLARGVHGNPNEKEDILTLVLPAEEFIARARRGELTDLKTLVAAYWLAEQRRARREFAHTHATVSRAEPQDEES